MKKINLKEFSKCLQAYQSCVDSGNKEWEEKWEMKINEYLIYLPSGSGLDAGVKFDWNSMPTRLTFSFSFHHLNENGYYNGWTHHKLIVTPEFGNFNIKITGSAREGGRTFKEYLSDLFYETFTIY